MTLQENNSGLWGKKISHELVKSGDALQVKPNREFHESALFLASIIIALLISVSIDIGLMISDHSVDLYSNTFVWSYTAVVCGPMLAYLWWLKKPLSEFGVTLLNWKQSLKEGILVTGILLALGVLAISVSSVKEGESLISHINWEWLKPETLLYIPHSIIQEFIFRGVVLTTLLKLLRNHSLWLPLLLSNLIFAFMHMHLGIAAVTMTFLVGYLFSWMYLRHNNILGISITHIILGSAAFTFGIL